MYEAVQMPSLLADDIWAVLRCGASFVSPHRWHCVQVGVSSCQFGATVAYDGRPRPFSLRGLGAVVTVVPLCPEVGMGLGVPRPPIRLIKMASGNTVLSDNLDSAMKRYASGPDILRKLQTMDAFIGKRGSPSCGGPNTVPSFSEDGTMQFPRDPAVRGAFRDLLHEVSSVPLPTCDGTDLCKWSKDDFYAFWEDVWRFHCQRAPNVISSDRIRSAKGRVRH